MSRAVPLHIASVVDDRYAQHLGVAMRSVLEGLETGTPVVFHIVHERLSTANRHRLAKTAAPFGAAVRFRNLDDRRLDGFYTSHHITKAAYYKIFIPELMRGDPIDRLIYMDCDVLAIGSVRELWETPLRGTALAAVEDVGGGGRCAELGIARYFNAGLFVIDLRRWRDRQITERTLAFIGRHPHKLVYHDQDALNAVLHNDWLPLDRKWNYQTNMLPPHGREPKHPPVIVHFTGSSKPWHFDNDHPYKKRYLEQLLLTEWRDYKPPLGTRSIALRSLKWLLPKPLVMALIKLKTRAYLVRYSSAVEDQ